MASKQRLQNAAEQFLVVNDITPEMVEYFKDVFNEALNATEDKEEFNNG